ncbi:MAG: transposase [Oligoflexia bacterium]|nr:transposase [Oligoflexia bacterium]
MKCGCIIVLHVCGRRGNYRPHLHILVMNGGIDLLTGDWIDIGYFPYEKILPRKWQYYLLKMVKSFGGDEIKALVDKLWKKYPKGFVNFFVKGDVPKRMKKLIKYLSRYITRPSISLKRILAYDKDRQEVEYEYLSHDTDKMEKEKVSVFTFIGRMIQQVLPRGFQKVRYFGLQATRSYKKNKEKINMGLESEKLSELNSEVFKASKQTYSDRIEEWTGHNPLICSRCKRKMEITKVWIRGKGFVFDLFEKLSQAPPDIIIRKLRKTTATDSYTFSEGVEEKAYFQLSLALGE